MRIFTLVAFFIAGIVILISAYVWNPFAEKESASVPLVEEQVVTENKIVESKPISTKSKGDIYDAARKLKINNPDISKIELDSFKSSYFGKEMPYAKVTYTSCGEMGCYSSYKVLQPNIFPTQLDLDDGFVLYTGRTDNPWLIDYVGYMSFSHFELLDDNRMISTFQINKDKAESHAIKGKCYKPGFYIAYLQLNQKLGMYEFTEEKDALIEVTCNLPRG